MNPNDEVVSLMLSAKVGALRFGAGIARDQQDLVAALLDDLRRRHSAVTPGMLARSADARTRNLADTVGGRIDRALDDLVRQRIDQFVRQWSRVVGHELNAPRGEPTAALLGGSARDWLESAGVRTANKAKIAALGGEKVSELLDPFQQLARDVRSVARTGASAAHNAAVEAMARANRSAIDAVVAVATLDGRTTLLCISRHGGAWDVVSGDPTSWSSVDEPYPGAPPWHFNCRTTLSPVFAGQPLPNMKDADRWLSSAAGREALGPSRVALWEKGEITRSQLVDQAGRPVTVDELDPQFV